MWPPAVLPGFPPLFHLMEGERQSQVPASLAHAVVHLRCPVMLVEQVVRQLQLCVAALRQAFFTSSMVMREV